MAGVDWRSLRNSLFRWFWAKRIAFLRIRYCWRAIRLILPFLLLSLLLDLTETLKLEGWKERFTQAYLFAGFVLVVFIFVMVALRFAQKHGWWGLLRWKTFYFIFATAFIGLVWTVVSLIEGYQIKLVHILGWMLLGQAAARGFDAPFR